MEIVLRGKDLWRGVETATRIVDTFRQREISKKRFGFGLYSGVKEH